MNIILDTNIFRKDIELSSNHIAILLSYLKKTNSQLIIPEIILEELKHIYIQILDEQISAYNKSIRTLKKLSISKKLTELIYSDKEKQKELKNYINFVFKKLNINSKNIIKYKDSYLPEIVRRAINKIKPFNINERGFRDTIIWLTLKDYCLTCVGKQLIFISNNLKDFGTPDGMLDHELVLECKKDGIKIYYYAEIIEFIKQHGINLDFITKDWLSTLINKPTFLENISYSLENNLEKTFINYYEQETKKKFFGFIHIYRCLHLEIKDYFINEIDNNNYVITITTLATMEIDFLNEIEENKFRTNSEVDHEDTKYYDAEIVISIKINSNKEILKTDFHC